MNIGPLLIELRDIIDQREQLSAQDSILSARKTEIERELVKYHESTGLKTIGDDRIGVTFDPDAMRAKYDPEAWKSIVRWAVGNDYDYLIQRRITDSKLIELVNSGVGLPTGLSLETYTRISARRK